MRFKPMPPLERVQEVLEYDPESGSFKWKVYRSANAKAGELAGSVASTGYVFLTLESSRYLAHRVAWYFQTGDDPLDGIVDHRDGVKTNNSWSNLRLGTQANNRANSRTRSNSLTGLKGVHYYKRVGKWMAGIRVDGRKIHLGYFDSPDLAFEAYQAAALEHHGEFARFD